MDLGFGTWNVTSLWRTDTPKTVESELAKYKSDLVVVQEVKWDKSDSQPADDYTFSNEMWMLIISN